MTGRIECSGDRSRVVCGEQSMPLLQGELDQWGLAAGATVTCEQGPEGYARIVSTEIRIGDGGDVQWE